VVCRTSAGTGESEIREHLDDIDFQVHDAIIPIAAIPAIQKSQAALAIAECDKALCEGGDEELQLLECCLRVREAMFR
jgi:replication factor C subunit 2/4